MYMYMGYGCVGKNGDSKNAFGSIFNILFFVLWKRKMQKTSLVSLFWGKIVQWLETKVFHFPMLTKKIREHYLLASSILFHFLLYAKGPLS